MRLRCSNGAIKKVRCRSSDSKLQVLATWRTSFLTSRCRGRLPTPRSTQNSPDLRFVFGRKLMANGKLLQAFFAHTTHLPRNDLLSERACARDVMCNIMLLQRGSPDAFLP